MKLIVDSGSTKADWVILDENGNQPYGIIKTQGMNPAVFTKEDLEHTINSHDILKSISTKIDEVFFYGAGCGTEKPRLLLFDLLQTFFVEAKVNVLEDSYAAIYATISHPEEAGIVCILGTGSNCSYYNGNIIEQRVTSLGYTIMDDASGNYFGKQLLRDYYFNKMPKNIKEDFGNQFDLSADTIKFNLYKKPFPNAYLASFSKIMITHKRTDYIKNLIRSGLELFVENMILQYKKELKNVPVHFVGSISYFCKEELDEMSKHYDFKLGKVLQKPIDDLINYHITYN